MTQYTLKNACMIVLILLAGIALNPTWAGGDHHQVKIKIIGDDFELDETDISGLAVGESMTFYTDNGREVFVTREDGGFDISIDGESLDLPRLSNSYHGIKVIHKEIICDGDLECDHEFINIHAAGDFELLELMGEELALDIEIFQDFECGNEEECNHTVKIWHSEDGELMELLEHGNFEGLHGDGKEIIIIKRQIHAEAGEEI